jgi:hypothetical protein
VKVGLFGTDSILIVVVFVGTFGLVGIAPCYSWPVATIASFSRLSLAVLSFTSRAHAELNKLYLEELLE